MSSQALYRQYRPQRFDDVIGQEIAVRTLRNAIEQDRVAHAYLFTGTRGTGKTTTAKLLAKAMNCVNGPTVDPCGVCEECTAIAEGRSMNVVEIDAASNTGVQDVRDMIIDTVAFQPSSGTRRVYILDEAHMLSNAAFNALLKTIEEPPAHVLFVFCTTETHKMPATVRDRCQRLVMKSPGPDTLAEVLQKVCAAEQITADEPALRAIARAANGSFRNALATLEMLTTTFGTDFTRDEVLQHLGVVSEEVLFEAADAVIDSDAATVLRLVERLVQDGVDIDQFARSLAEHLRSVLLQLHGLAQHATVGDPARLAAQAERAQETHVLAAIDCLADAATRMRVGSDARISLETALVRACQGLGLPALALRLAALEHGATGSYGKPVTAAGTAPAAPTQAAPAPTAPAAAPAAAAPTTVSTPPARPATPEPAPPAAAPAMSPAATSAPDQAAGEQPVAPAQMPDGELQNVAAWWPQVAQKVAASPALRPMLTKMQPASADSRSLALQLSEPILGSAKLEQTLAAAAYEVTGHKLKVELLAPGAAPAAASAPAPSAASATSAAPVEPQATPAQAPRPARPAPAAPAGDAEPDAGIENLMSMFDATPVTPDE